MLTEEQIKFLAEGGPPPTDRELSDVIEELALRLLFAWGK